VLVDACGSARALAIEIAREGAKSLLASRTAVELVATRRPHEAAGEAIIVVVAAGDRRDEEQ
jgi:hypothetical protein